MAAVTALALGSLALTGVSMGMNYYNAKQQGRTEQALAQRNARQRRLDAVAAEQETRENIRRERRSSRRFMATQRAAFAKAGVTMEGTPLEVMADTAADLELRAQDILYGGNNRAARLRQAADYDLVQGEIAYRTGRNRAGASLISGLSKIASDAGEFNYRGAFNNG